MGSLERVGRPLLGIVLLLNAYHASGEPAFTCDVHEEAAQTAEAQSRESTTRSQPLSGCALVRAAYLSDPENTEWLVVDVRAGDRYEDYHIRPSINIAAHELRTKAFLRDRSIVLADEGYGYTNLFGLCQRLKEAGFRQVSVLEGGVNLWRRSGNAWEGRIKSYSMPTIEAKEAFEQYREDEWTIIGLADVQRHAPLEALFSIRPARDFADLSVQVDQTLAGGRKIGPVVVIATDRGEGYAEVQKALEKLHVNAFFLKGGLGALADHVKWQQAVWSKRESALARVSRCASR